MDSVSTAQFVQPLFASRYVEMGSVAIAVFDWAITLDLEVSLVWNSKWNVTKAIFILNRYLPVVDFALLRLIQETVQVDICQSLLRGKGSIYIFAFYTAEYILSMRVLAVWKMNKVVIVVLSLFALGSFIFANTSYHRMVARTTFFSVLPLKGCLNIITERCNVHLNFIIMGTYDFGMLCLMAYPTLKEYISNYDVFTKSRLIRSIYTEGVMFYAYLFGLSIVSITLQFRALENMFLFIYASRMIRSVLASRALLHTRVLSLRGDDEEFTDEQVISELIFS